MGKGKVFIRMVVIRLILLWGYLFYDKKYLKGKHFSRRNFTKGWSWILKYWFGQKVLRKNGDVNWPVPPHVLIADPNNIIFDLDDMNNFHTAGNYFQGIGATITIGKGTAIAPNCGFITANHDFSDITKSAEAHPILIGENCWIGMNSVILPGVHLGKHTIVGAGSIVTKSFPEGNCVIAGNPAKLLKKLP